MLKHNNSTVLNCASHTIEYLQQKMLGLGSEHFVLLREVKYGRSIKCSNNHIYGILLLDDSGTHVFNSRGILYV